MTTRRFQQRRRPKPGPKTPTARKNMKQHVRDVFARVLERSPDVDTFVLSETQGHYGGWLYIIHRSNYYLLNAMPSGTMLQVEVFKCHADKPYVENPEGDDFGTYFRNSEGSFGENGGLFFKYMVQVNNPGKLKKMALILLKKMDYREVHDVMST